MTDVYERYPHIKSVDALDESHIHVTCYSPWGTINSMELPVSLEVLEDWTKTEKTITNTGLSILSPDQREFLMTGMTPKEWDGLFGLFETNDE